MDEGSTPSTSTKCSFAKRRAYCLDADLRVRPREHLMGVTLAFDMAYGSKIDNPLGSVTATKITANEDFVELPMAA